MSNVYTEKEKQRVKEYDAATQSKYDIGVPNLESLFPILKIEQYLFEINKQILMYVWSGWMGGWGCFYQKKRIKRKVCPLSLGTHLAEASSR